MNAILVIVDSLRMDHMGCYADCYARGGLARTPHLDRLAAASVRFTRAEPESLPTLPCRRALHTGQRTWPFRHNLQPKGDFVGAPGWGPIPEEQDTMAELLSRAGYRTGFITDTYHQFKPGKNFHRGFQEWQWIRGQETDPYRTGPYIADEQVFRHLPQAQRSAERFVARHRQYLMNVAERRSEEDYFPAQVFRAAADWLNRNQDAAKFLLVVDSFDPHEPWDPPAYYRRMYDPDDPEVADVIWAPYGRDRGYSERELKRLQGNYAGEATMVDRWFGHFYEAFLDSGRAEDTLLIMTTDHGHYVGDQGYTGKMGYPLWRGVCDVPVLMRDSGGRRAGETEDGFVSHTDIPATILEACGVETERPIEGRSLLGVLDGGPGPGRDHTLTGWGPFIAIRKGPWWYNSTLWGHKPLLYNVDEDPMCEADVAEAHGDVVREMYEIGLADCDNDYPEFLKDMARSAMPGCTPLGQM